MSTSSRLCLTVSHAHGHTVVTAVGSIDTGTVMQLRSMLLQTLIRDGPYAVLDLAAVDDIDDAGFDALRRTADRAAMLGGHFRLAAPQPAIAGKLNQTGLDQHIGGHDQLTATTHTAHHRHPLAPKQLLPAGQRGSPVGPPTGRGPLRPRPGVRRCGIRRMVQTDPAEVAGAAPVFSLEVSGRASLRPVP